jgi:hypothetical protein
MSYTVRISQMAWPIFLFMPMQFETMEVYVTLPIPLYTLRISLTFRLLRLDRVILEIPVGYWHEAAVAVYRDVRDINSLVDMVLFSINHLSCAVYSTVTPR